MDFKYYPMRTLHPAPNQIKRNASAWIFDQAYVCNPLSFFEIPIFSTPHKRGKESGGKGSEERRNESLGIPSSM
jgi:hypothetical protein